MKSVFASENPFPYHGKEDLLDCVQFLKLHISTLSHEIHVISPWNQSLVLWPPLFFYTHATLSTISFNIRYFKEREHNCSGLTDYLSLSTPSHRNDTPHSHNVPVLFMWSLAGQILTFIRRKWLDTTKFKNKMHINQPNLCWLQMAYET